MWHFQCNLSDGVSLIQFGYAGLFCVCVQLFCGYVGLFDEYVGFLADLKGFLADMCLFGGCTGLFWRKISLQHTATRFPHSTRLCRALLWIRKALFWSCRALLRAHCNILQHTAKHWNTLQHMTNTLQTRCTHSAIHCNSHCNIVQSTGGAAETI